MLTHISCTKHYVKNNKHVRVPTCFEGRDQVKLHKSLILCDAIWYFGQNWDDMSLQIPNTRQRHKGYSVIKS